jgi:hypothetical protein
MKQVFLSGCVLGLALSLSACGGGGGGGSGSGSTPVFTGDPFTFTVKGMAGDATQRNTPSLSNADRTAEALASSGSGMRSDLKSGYSLASQPPNSYKLKIESNGSVTLKNNSLTVATFDSNNMGFYRKNGIDFVTMLDTRPGTSSIPNFQGSQTEKNAIWLLKLDHSSFGYWSQVLDKQGRWTDTNSAAQGIGMTEGALFYQGTIAQYNNNNLSFTGITVGTAEYYADNGRTHYTIPIVGTADLTIKNILDGTLVLSFPEFYKFTGSVTTLSNGSLSGKFSIFEKLGSAFPVNLPTAASSYNAANKIEGQLYGGANNNPTEAGGLWQLGSTDSGKVFVVQGVFGAKKK